MAIVITGNPGVGKHTVARGLAGRRGLEILDLSQAAIASGAAEKAGDTLDVDTDMLAGYLKDRISENSLVVGHLAPYVVPSSQVEKAIVLRRSPYKLDSIYRSRGYSESKRIENQGSEILGVVAHEAAERFGRDRIVQIDTSDRSVEDTVEAADKALSGRMRGNEVDWLYTVEAAGDMKRFFPTD